MAIIRKHTLGKQEKLKSRKQIEKLFASGKGFTVFPFKVVYLMDERPLRTDHGKQMTDDGGQMTVQSHQTTNDGASKVAQGLDKAQTAISNPSSVQIGVTVSSRHFKHAHDRNRIKRLMREVYRLQKQPLLDVTNAKNLRLSVFFIFIDKSLPTFAVLNQAMSGCLSRLGKMAGAK
jgi:ribonuclease P protein component